MASRRSTAVELDRQRIAALAAARARRCSTGALRAPARCCRRARRVLPGGVVSSFQVRGHGRSTWRAARARACGTSTATSTWTCTTASARWCRATPTRRSAPRWPRATTAARTSPPRPRTRVVVAEELCRRFGLPLWRFTNSGTESTMAAIRIARASHGTRRRAEDLRCLPRPSRRGDGRASAPGCRARWPSEVHDRRLQRRGRDGAPHRGARGRGSQAGLRAHGARDDGHRRWCSPEAGISGGGASAHAQPRRRADLRRGQDRPHDRRRAGPPSASASGPTWWRMAKALGAGLPTGAVGMTAELAAGVEDGSVPQLRHLQRQPAGHGRGAREPARGPHHGGLRAAGAHWASCWPPASASADRPSGRCAARVTGLGSKGSVSYGAEPVVDHASYRRRHDPLLAELIWTFAMNRGVYTTPGREQEWNLSVAHGEAERGALPRRVRRAAGRAHVTTVRLCSRMNWGR